MVRAAGPLARRVEVWIGGRIHRGCVGLVGGFGCAWFTEGEPRAGDER